MRSLFFTYAEGRFSHDVALLIMLLIVTSSLFLIKHVIFIANNQNRYIYQISLINYRFSRNLDEPVVRLKFHICPDMVGLKATNQTKNKHTI